MKRPVYQADLAGLMGPAVLSAQVYLPQVEQPERRAFGWCLHVFTHRGTWGQAEPAVPRWSATCNSLQAPCQTGITSALPTELAMMSTHSTEAAEEYHTEKQQQ
ncbi:hypothetical protein WJX82_008985 [Trebouxia sp. C0006]